MPKNLAASRKLLLCLGLFVCTISLLITSGKFPIAYADDPCEDISDLDDRAECYEDEIAETEEEYESTSKKLSDVRAQKNSVSSKIEGLLGQLTVTQAEIDALQQDIDEMVANLDKINQTLLEKNTDLEKKITFRNKVIRTYTKRSVLNDLEIFFHTAENVGNLGLSGFQLTGLSYGFEKSLGHEALRLIGAVTTEIKNYEADKLEAQKLKDELETAQGELLSAKNVLSITHDQAAGELNELATKEGDYEEDLRSLSDRIESFSAKQREVLVKKFGEGYFSIGDYELNGWEVPDPPFSPAFGGFSFGAFTHYNGMSQYGAYGRAEDGQNYEDIIEFYYNESVDEDDDFPDEICVEGHGTMSFQKYLYGLAEMPSDWPMDALKAQAIAGRSYAYRRVQNGGCICTTQSCQVYLQSKADNPPSRWKEAVDDTKDMIIAGDTGASGYGWYSSTTGGYVNQGGWDTKGSWPNDAYEKRADSPWFYWAWYSESYRFDSDTCGRDYPWLDEEEMADILNAWEVWRHGQTEHISPVTTSCWGGDPYSHEEMADKADEVGTAYDEVYDIDVDIGSNGMTNAVTVDTDKGSLTINGEEFKTVFNLRAPGFVALRSRLYDFQVR